MRNYRNAAAALVLALILSTPSFAGIMYTDKAAPTPTPVPVAAAVTTDPADGEVVTDTGAAETTPSAADSMIAEVAAVLARSVLTLF